MKTVETFSSTQAFATRAIGQNSDYVFIPSGSRFTKEKKRIQSLDNWRRDK